MGPSRPLALAALVMVAVACASTPGSTSSGRAPSSRTPSPDIAASHVGRTHRIAPTHQGAKRAGRPAPWPGYHGGGAHRGFSRTMPVARTVHVARRLRLDGAVYGSPIAVKGHVVVATERDTVYSFSKTGRRQWRRHVGTPVPRAKLPCGNIDPLGITGTPVYSPRTGDVYVVAERVPAAPKHTLIAIHLATGKVAWRRSVDFPGRDASAMQQRGALAVDGRRVWVTFGGLEGDCANYGGRLIGIQLNGKGRAARYDVPTAREAGMWQASGPAVDSKGRLLVSVGNGAATFGDRYDHSDSVLELDANARLLSFFAPRNWAADNAGDVDLGSVGPALVGNRWIVQGGKSTTVRVLRQGRLGGIGGEVSSRSVCASFGGAAVRGRTVYLPCTDGVRALRVDRTGHLHVRWHFGPGASGSPVVGGRRVWIISQNDGVLYAASPRTGRVMRAVSVGPTSRFATPALYGRRVLVPTMSGLTIVRTR